MILQTNEECWLSQSPSLCPSARQFVAMRRVDSFALHRIWLTRLNRCLLTKFKACNLIESTFLIFCPLPYFATAKLSSGLCSCHGNGSNSNFIIKGDVLKQMEGAHAWGGVSQIYQNHVCLIWLLLIINYNHSSQKFIISFATSSSLLQTKRIQSIPSPVNKRKAKHYFRAVAAVTP